MLNRARRVWDAIPAWVFVLVVVGGCILFLVLTGPPSGGCP